MPKQNLNYIHKLFGVTPMAPVVSPGISPLRTALSREEGMLTTFGVLSIPFEKTGHLLQVHNDNIIKKPCWVINPVNKRNLSATLRFLKQTMHTYSSSGWGCLTPSKVEMRDASPPV